MSQKPNSDVLKRGRDSNQDDEMRDQTQQARQNNKTALEQDRPRPLLSVRDPVAVWQDQASEYKRQGTLAKAEEMYRRAVVEFTNILGAEDFRTLMIISGLVSTLKDRGRLNRTEHLNKQILEGFMKLGEPECPETLTSVDNLALIYEKKGKLVEAEEMYQRAVEGYTKLGGPDSPETLKRVKSLASIYERRSKFVLAGDMYRRAVEAYQRLFGPDHPDTLENVYNLGSTYELRGKLVKAEELYRRAYAGNEKIRGQEHPETLASAQSLALVLANQRKWAQVEEMSSTNALGKERPRTPRIGDNLAPVHHNPLIDSSCKAIRPLCPEDGNDSGSDLMLDRDPETPPSVDLGYSTIPNALSKNQQQDDDGVSIRSLPTVVNHSWAVLPLQQEKYLISAFVGDLCHDIVPHGDFEARDRIATRLSDLLRTFSLRLEKSVKCKTELDAKESIWQHRDRITYQFRKRQMPVDMPEDEGLPTLRGDSMSSVQNMLLWPAEHSYFLPASGSAEQQLDEAQEPPRYQEVRSFLLDGPAYQWLLENARSSALLTERKGTVLEAVSRKIDDTLTSIRTSKLQHPPVFQMIFDMDWDLPNFLRAQEYDATLEIAFERAITVTACQYSAQALSCIDYMCQTWPSSGREVVRVLQKALMSPSLSCSSCIADGMELEIDLRLQKGSVVARGTHAALNELSEQLAWLGCAFQSSPVSFGICYTSPNIVVLKDVHSSSPIPSITAQLGFVTLSQDHGLSTDADGTCWHALFRNSVVADGFPILARHENEQGLELPLDMMSILAEARFATHYDRTLILKGHCTMLVPTRRTERSVTWHFIVNEGGKRLPYYSFRERCPGWIGTDKVNTNLLEDDNIRHFVGWASKITRHLGAEDMKYGEIDWAGARVCSAGLALEQKLTITASKFIGGNVAFSRGTRNKPLYVEQGEYSIQIENARSIYVVLYDIATQRGWLTDGASALLHLVRTQVVRKPYGSSKCLFNNPESNSLPFHYPRIDGGPNAAVEALTEDRNMRHIIRREFYSYSDEKIAVSRLGAASIANEHSSNNAANSSGNEIPNASGGRTEIYKTTCLRELVSQTWGTLEHIYDSQIDIATTHTTKELQDPFRITLEGYEFMDIVSAKHILTPRTVGLQSNGSAWAGLTRRINAITLFGQNFGDIYKPSENITSLICKKWRTVPRGHEYLVVPISLLKEIRLNSWREGKVSEDSTELAKHLLWSRSENTYHTCGSSCKHTFNRVQQLHSSTPALMIDKLGLAKKDRWKADNFAEINGAVLFGNNSNLDVRKLEPFPPAGAHTEGDHDDSALGSSLQDSSQATSAAEASSGEDLELQAARLSGANKRISPSPLDQTAGTNILSRDTGTIDLVSEQRSYLISREERLPKRPKLELGDQRRRITGGSRG